MRNHTSAAMVLGVLAFAGAAGCGSSPAPPDDSAAIEARISRERADAARSARQEERIKQLEAEAAETKKKQPATRTVTRPAPTPAPAAPPAAPARTPSPSDDWPGGSGQTVILASVGSQAEARRIQGQAAEAGLDAGVLFSSDYASLRAGYWVAFSGKFDTTNSASERQSRARSLGFSQAYVRFVSP